MQALSAESWQIEEGKALARDSEELKAALQNVHQGQALIHTGEGGTSFRFLLAYLVSMGFEGEVKATGSMSDRPIFPLIEALNDLGASISFVNRKSEAHLRLRKSILQSRELTIDGNISSQFISALLLVGPYLPEGLTLRVKQPIVSDTYIQLTMQMMRRFGIELRRKGDRFLVPSGRYRSPSSKPYKVEADWTAASYFWMHSHALGVEKLHMLGLSERSWQGDRILSEWSRMQGATSFFSEEGWHLFQNEKATFYFGSVFDGKCVPDLTISHISLYAFAGLSASYSGLSTLLHKESNRLLALQEEWGKAGVEIRYSADGSVHLSMRSAEAQTMEPFRFLSHEDHRIAMCLSILAAREKVAIHKPQVVEKSFPHFWKELKKLGYQVKFSTSPEF